MKNDVTLGEIVERHSFGFLKINGLVTVNKLSLQEAESLYDDYKKWCFQENIYPHNKDSFMHICICWIHFQ